MFIGYLMSNKLPSTYKLSPILEVAKEILSEVKEMHVNDIAQEAVKRNKNLGMPLQEFAKKLTSSLNANLKLKTRKPLFSQPLNKKGGVRRGYYRLRRGANPTTPIIKIPPPTFNTLYTGRAGEYAVASELLFWGFNISAMAVDRGIDLIAEKDGKFKYIQVKTSTARTDENHFSFIVEQSKFDANLSNSPWYIFVMRQGTQIDYAVIPCSHLIHLRSSGFITGKNLSIQISRDDKKKQYKLNLSHDINMYINNFALLG